jgi:photosystem II stability/assembly factor-like uncharacterized protein
MNVSCLSMSAALIVASGLVCWQPSLSAQREPARTRWTKQAPIPTTSGVQGVAALSSTECWVAAAGFLDDSGELAHTTDAGRTWTVTSVDHQVVAVAFVDPLHGWAGGNAFYRTTDGGQTWIKGALGSILDLFFLDTLHGWAAATGGYNYYTADGGVHWNIVYANGGNMTSIFFTDLLNGWSVDLDGQIFHSADGGKTWALKSKVNGFNLSMIQFFDALEGWAIGGDAFYHTTDGGKTWTKAVVPSKTWAYGGRFFDRLHGVAVGEAGNIVRTSDGGVTWKTIKAQGAGQRLWDVEYADLNTAFYGGDNGAISRSIDGGATWASIQSGGAAVTHGLDSIDARHAWAGQDGGEVVYTVNSGRQWIRVVVQPFDSFGKIMAVAFADTSTGWAGGSDAFFGGSTGIVSRSTNGGKTWQQQEEILNFTFNGLEAIDRLTAFVVGGFDSVGGEPCCVL